MVVSQTQEKRQPIFIADERKLYGLEREEILKHSVSDRKLLIKCLNVRFLGSLDKTN